MTYKELVNKLTPKENRINNMIISFISGGVIGSISYIISLKYNNDIMLIIWIVLSSFLTGLGVFDNIVDKLKMGVIIPITGFAHSITSSSMEYKREGLITGIGANYFKLAGSVILYGIISSTVFNLLGGLINVFKNLV